MTLLKPNSLAALLLSTAVPALADVTLPALFSDHMVMQADVNAPVWGWADAGEEVTVSLAGHQATARTGADGRWRTNLPPMKSRAEPLTLTVEGKNKLVIQDVLIGEVWLASGQSNMAFQFSRGQYAQAETEAAALPQVRMFTVKAQSTRAPQERCEGAWVVATPETVGAFSAVAWFFGKELHGRLGAPVGMINSSWGGTDIAAWTSEEAQAGVPALKEAMEAWKARAAAFDAAKAEAAHEKRLAAWKEAVRKAKAEGRPAPRGPRKEAHPDVSQNRPANLFNGMISPLIPYALRGAIWYQGEHNCATVEKASLYATQLPLLIQDWRARWDKELAFAWVQLPNFEQTAPRPLVREAMLKSLSVPNTGMAVTIDAGEANDNHPKDKKTVGGRLALWALAKVYGADVPAWSGPLPAGHEVRGGEVVLGFEHTTGGLAARGGELRGFMIAGTDKVWKPGTARIEGGKVVVSSAEVAAPVAVRYSWASNPDGNLFNGAGLPASPFRTDDWEITVP
ncbi:MAG TPA: sialate O-acetylesterase [Prosthecobacter sp.]|nr:sialate O-acetylesterase [Bryobacterales bacterium]HRJ09435.1 sialate O-acetylesterase [Prosthecobacter sp.]HRK16145.1 sialate O-acetylesterase [Prosthecobacter sp.]